MANLKKIMDDIWLSASTDYQARIPQITQTDTSVVAGEILKDQNLRNEFLNLLVNKICMQVVEKRRYANPLKSLKKGGSPYGKFIEHIMVNPAIAKSYDYKSTDLFKVVPPDVKACYYKVNRMDQYPVTITVPMMRQAMQNDSEMGNLINMITNSLYSGDEQDEFMLMKGIFTKAISAGHVKKVSVYTGDLTNMDLNAKKELASGLLENLQLYSDMFTFVGDDYNQYKTLQIASMDNPTQEQQDAIVGAQTFCPKANQNIIITAFAKNIMTMNLLANVFQLSVVELQQKMLVVDSLGDGVLAVLCDETFTQVRDVDFAVENFYNIDQRSMKYILNHDQSLGYCTFANCLAFTYTQSAGTP